MKNYLMSLLITIPFFSNAEEIQIIKVDEQHIQMGLAEGQVGKYYLIDSATQLQLDAEGYEFPDVAGLNSNEPNAIQLIIDNDQQFTVPWKSGVTKYTLNSDTLIARFKDFKGFKSGQQFVIAIGFLVTKNANKEQAFKVQWVGMGKVGI